MLIYFENKPAVRSRNSLKIKVDNPSSLAMDPPLSAYWVKFFKNAGFPSDVATRHAVVFSNNRIKPDMLPDLDKPSLKEMGITLMGDMIAILRYAKKVVEDTTCKKFLGSSEDSPPPNRIAPKPVVKKIVGKPPMKAAAKSKTEVGPKVVSSSTSKPIAVKKKLPSVTQTSRLYSDYVDTKPKPKPLLMKRKYDSEDEEMDIDGKWVHNESSKRLKSSDVKYNVVMPKLTTDRSQKILKKALEHKRTVFHRLGDSMVSSTTNVDSGNSSFSPTFNVTGVDSFKRSTSSSVFNRLGNKDEERQARNGSVRSQGILKTRTPLLGTKILTTKPVLKKPIGTMRADEEAVKKTTSLAVKQLVNPIKNLKFSEKPSFARPIRRGMSTTGKLASERMEMPAKSRLGASKQVTFNRTTTINHIRKPGVFSRLGV